MNGKQISQLKKPTDSQEENYSSLERDTGFAAQREGPFGGKRTFSLKNSNDSALPARKNNQVELGIFSAQENLTGEGAGGGRHSYPASARHTKKRSQVSCCAFQPVGQLSLSEHQRFPGHPGAVPGALDVPLICGSWQTATARVSPTAASVTL